jgi:hypothetical protein
MLVGGEFMFEDQGLEATDDDPVLEVVHDVVFADAQSTGRVEEVDGVGEVGERTEG